MRKNITIIIAVFSLFALTNNIKAQTFYNSVTTGNWNSTSTWVVTTYSFIPTPPFVVVNTAPATTPPSTTDYVSINAGHTVTVNSNENANSVTLASTSSSGSSDLIVSSGANLSLGTDLYVYPTNDGSASVTNDGTINITNKLELNVGNAVAVAQIVNNGTITSGNLAMIEATGSTNITLNANSTLTTGNVSVTNTATANTTIDLSSGNAIFEVSGNFTGSNPTLTGGTLGSIMRFAGSSAQTIKVSNTAFTIDSLEITNTSGATIDAPLTVSNLNRGININTGGVFSLGGFGVNVSTNVINDGTINVSGNLNIAEDFTSTGNVTSTGGSTITVGGDWSSTGTVNANGNIDIDGDYTSSGSFTSTGSNINVGGNWNNSGTYTFNNGDIVTIDGTGSAATITGSTNFYELVINKPGATINVASGTNIDIISILDLDGGSFVVPSSSNVTLVSNASGTAQLDAIETGMTDYLGEITVQRYLAMGNDGWRELTSPVAGTTLANWQDDGIILTGFTGADYDASNWFGWINTWTYTEANANGVKDNGWVSATNNTNPTNYTKGHRIYVGTGNNTLSVKGTPNKGFVGANVTNGGGGSADDQNGWNLIGNPFPCTVDWNTLFKSGIDQAYWIWNATAGNYGVYQTNAATGTNGVDNHIAHSQAFWVHGSQATGFVFFQESNKVRNDKAFVKSNVLDEFVRIKLSGNVNSFYDEAILQFNQNSTPNYDEGIDQNKLFTELEKYAPSLAITTNDNYNLSIAGVNEFKSSTIPLKAYAGDSAHGTYTIEFNFPNGALSSSCITLEDLETGVITDLKTNPNYTFTTSENSPQDRFLIHITTPFESVVYEPSCTDLTDASIKIEGTNVNGNTFTISNNNGVLNTVVANNNQVIFENLSSGDYIVTSSQSSACGHNSIDINVPNPQEVVASFELENTVVYLDDNAEITPQNNSNGTNYSWDFGDGNISFEQEPTHTYTSPGTYTITLTVGTNGCEDVYTKTIEVKTTTSIKDNSSKLFELISHKDYINITINKELSNYKINITDLSGKVIYSNKPNGNTVNINTSKFAKGFYLVNLFDELNNTYTEKVLVK